MSASPRSSLSVLFVSNVPNPHTNGGRIYLTIRRPNSDQTDVLIDTPYGAHRPEPDALRSYYEMLLAYHQIEDAAAQRMISYIICFIDIAIIIADMEEGIPKNIYFTITDYNPHAIARMDRDFLITDLGTTKRMANENEAREECFICLEALGGNEQINKLKCSHIYHSQCIVSWLYSKMNCPICRSIDL